jgi:hypothetical protein
MSNNRLLDRMKKLGEEGEYRQVLSLFDKLQRSERETIPIIIHVLKACAYLGDYKRGHLIHHSMASWMKNDRYILSSLLHFYSASIDLSSPFSLM